MSSSMVIVMGREQKGRPHQSNSHNKSAGYQIPRYKSEDLAKDEHVKVNIAQGSRRKHCPGLLSEVRFDGPADTRDLGDPAASSYWLTDCNRERASTTSKGPILKNVERRW